MTYYFFGLSLRSILLGLKGNQVYVLNPARSDSIFMQALARIPFIKTWFNNLAPEPDIHIGDHKGLYYKLNEETLECAEFVCNRLKLEDCQFIEVYSERFKTNKLKPFVLKWVSLFVLELLGCLYRVHLDKPSQKVLYLHNSLLNRHIYEWWSRKTGAEIAVKWLKRSEIQSGLEALTLIAGLFVYKLFSRGLCWPPRRREIKIIKEAAWGLRNPVFRDDFFVDGETLLKRDLLLYTYGSSNEIRVLAWKDAQNSQYECMNISKLRVPLNLLFQRLFRYHFLLPLVFVFKNLGNRQNYLVKEWLMAFHVAAINYEILLSHYQIGLELSINESGLTHIPETIILNNYGAKNIIWNWSDMTSFDDVGEKFKSHNLYLVWGRIHYDFHGRQYFVDKRIETGLIFNYNSSELTDNKRNIYEKLGLPINDHRVLVFYDESFNPAIHFTEEVLLDFWQMMSELIDEREDVIAVLKPKWGNENQYDKMSDQGRELFNNIRARCLASGRFYFIDNPGEVSVTEVIAISDINITMGMCSPSTIALICGKIGLYYDTTGNDQHPFARQFRDKVVFDSKRGLLLAVSKIIDQGYDPLDEIEPGLLKDYDHFRDDKGLERFREALLKNL